MVNVLDTSPVRFVTGRHNLACFWALLAWFFLTLGLVLWIFLTYPTIYDLSLLSYYRYKFKKYVFKHVVGPDGLRQSMQNILDQFMNEERRFDN
ncbi:hypothetical protein RUM43_001489 [Polyplax serrata]|uniref:Uncharacterized protein n=1 Tax=Polyplax serrata TaxID=468196 RepID=A0AAN8SDZ2_POLSC